MLRAPVDEERPRSTQQLLANYRVAKAIYPRRSPIHHGYTPRANDIGDSWLHRGQALLSPTWKPSTRGLRLVLSHTARDPDPPVYCRDSFGDIFTLTSGLEPNYRQDLYVRATAIKESIASIQMMLNLQRGGLWSSPAPTLHIPRITAQLCNRDRGVDNGIVM